MKSKQKETIEPIRCECGGHLRAATIPEYDFSDYVGFKVTLLKVPGLRCDKCDGETIDGEMVNRAMNLTLRRVTESPRRLHGSEARFLRQNLGITQEELSIRMGIDRVTVGHWECGDKPISPQHDYILRGLILSALVAVRLINKETMNRIMGSVFRSVRTEPPIDGAVFDASELAMVNGAPAKHMERRLAL